MFKQAMFDDQRVLESFGNHQILISQKFWKRLALAFAAVPLHWLARAREQLRVFSRPQMAESGDGCGTRNW